MTNEQWRVGHSYDIHVYAVGPTSPDGDRPVATFHQPRDAHRAVRLVNSTTTDIVQRICAALNVPYETPDGHGMRRATLDEALSWIEGQRQVRDRLLQRVEQVDLDWLTCYRAGTAE